MMDMQECLKRLLETVQTERSVECVEKMREALRGITRRIGLCFHPDTECCEYISGVTEKPLFVGKELDALDRILTMCFTIVGDEVYEVCSTEMEAMVKETTQ